MTEDQLRDLLRNPTEGLNRELKTWFDPSTPEGRAKIVRAVFALRNRNGGELVIGFGDTTLRPDPRPADLDVAQLFSVDAVQTTLFKFASIAFEVGVAMAEVGGQAHPVISVPAGVEVPVVCKSDLKDGERWLLRRGQLYFRTLNESGVPASAPINPRDWPALMQICHDNRDATIGRFLRRHLGGSQLERLRDVAGELTPDRSLGRRAADVLKRGDEAYVSALARRSIPQQHQELLDGLAMTVAVALDPVRPGTLPTKPWATAVLASNPQYTGWPVWLDSFSSSDAADRPEVRAGGWEALVASIDQSWSDHLDFWRLEPDGGFYLHRLMQDDMTDKVEKGTAIDVVLMLYRVAEVLVVGTRMARAAGWDEADRAGFRFEWRPLAGRRLKAWANPRTFLMASGSPAVDDEATSYVEVPLETPADALAPFVQVAVAPLLTSFGGYMAKDEVVEEAVRKLLDRSL